MLRLRPLAVLFALALALCLLELWNTRSQTGTLRRLTNTSEEAINVNPSISGDGRRIAFESTEDLARAGGTDHFRAIRADLGGDPATFTQMAAARSPAPGISQDGSIVAFAAKEDPLGTNPDGNSEIFLYNGATLRQITNTTPADPSTRTRDGNFQPSLTDDGRFIAFSSNRNLANQNSDGNLEIFIFDTASNTFTQLTNTTGTVGATDAKISGDGSRVAYIRDNGSSTSTQRDLVLQDRTGGATRVLASNVANLAFTYGRAISDDGSRVVYSADTATNSSQVFLFDGRTTNSIRQITSLGARDTDVPLHPTISGDGTRLAFATRRPVTGFSNSDNSIELYTYDIPTSQFGRVTNAPSNADGFDGSLRATEVVSSLNDDGSVIAFNFPRSLSGAVTSGMENNSEIYVTATGTRPTSGTLTILNGASFGHEPATTKAVAPDSIAVAFGGTLSFTTQQAQRQADGSFPQTLGGTTVTVNGRRAQIFFVSPTQVNFLVPPQTELGNAEVIITNSEGFQSKGTVTVLRAAPGIFTSSGDGLGEGVVLNADTLQTGPFDPSSGNLRLVIFSTGVRNAQQVTATAGGRTLTVESFMPSPDMPGLDEVRVRVPADLRGVGIVELSINADGRDSNPVTINFGGDARRDIMINEVLADPPDGAAGDANHDGVRDSSDDEFVELVNTTTHDIAIGGYQLLTRSTGATSDTVRHTFAPGTIFPAGSAIVVFGGGNPNPADPIFGGAQVFKASTGGLSLVNSGGAVTLRDASQSTVNIFTYGGSTGLNGDANQSLTRAPDAGINSAGGNFTLHSTAPGSGGRLFSPGTRLDGSPFAGIPIARIEVSPSEASIDVGAKQQFTARAFNANGQEVTGVIFSWQSSNTSVATIDQNGLATGVAAGTTEIRASAHGASSAPATLTVKQPTRVLTSVVITPTAAIIGVGETQIFTAQAKDQFGQDFGGVTITFASSNTTVATVDSISPTSSTGSATATVTGRASGSAEIRATASTGATTVTSSPATLSVEPGAGQLLISEFRTRGPAGASDEFIEIYNPTTSTLLIGGLKIRASNSSGTISDRVTITAGTTLGPGCHYLVANNSSGGYSGTVPANQTYSTGITDDGGIAITGSNGTRIIDAVGMSSGSAYKEGTPLAPLSSTTTANQSYERKPGGVFGNGVDTDNNANDFVLTNPSNPQNSSSGCLDTSTADLSITKSASPGIVSVGSNITYTLTITNNGVAAAQNVTVTDNLLAAVAFDSCSSTAGGVCNGSGNNRTVTFSSLASGASATITLVAKANETAGATVINIATVSSTTPDPNQNNNTASATTTIQGALPLLAINDVSMNEGNAGTTTFSFTVSLSAPAPAGGVTFDIATQDGTATVAGNDYLAKSLTGQTIAAGNQTYMFDVTVNGDALLEPNETFFVNITNVSGATVMDGQGVGTIQNDDSSSLVISQVYGGGGNSGATYKNDFIEIFNRGTTTVDFSVTPYSVQYASVSTSSSGNFSSSNKTNITSGTIAPGQYFLIQEAAGSGGTTNLPMPDATGSIAMSATSGKVALVIGTSALPALTCPGDDGTSPFNPSSSTIADFVGYGDAASNAGHCYEGSGPAPAPSNTAADFRKADGCVDTNDNAADFFVAAPNPRNTASPLHNCNIADLSLTKSGSPTIVRAGDNLIYTLTVTNNGPIGEAQNVVVTDALPANTTLVSVGALPPGWTRTDSTPDGGAGTITFTKPNMSVGETATFNITVKVDSNATNGSTISNTATATSDALDTDQSNNSQTATNTVGTSADLSLVKTVNNTTPTVGDQIVFNILLSNAGPFAATGVAVRDLLPSGLTFVSANPSRGTYDSNTGVWDVGSVSPGFNVAVLRITAVVATPGFKTNVAEIIASDMLDPDSTPNNHNNFEDDQSSVSIRPVQPADLSITKTGSPDPVAIGSNITYTITVTNNGPADASGASLTDTIPANTTFKSLTAPAGWSCTTPAVNGTGTINCSNPTFTVGSAVFTLVVNVNSSVSDGTVISNTASVSSTTPDTNTANNSATQTATAKTPLLVISQVYGGGGNSGATFKNDFIEIFNRGTTTVDVTGWSVQYESATGPGPWSVTQLCATGPCLIAPGKYFLVQEAAGSGGTTNLPTPNATGSIAMTATAGKVALVNNTTALSGSCPSGAGILDLVGYGTTANCFEGAGPATAPGNTTADFRKSGGCVDTNNNAADFLAASPFPRNSSSPAHSCGVGAIPNLTINDVTAAEGNSGTTTFTFTVSLSSPSTGDVFFDIATQNGTATTANSDYVAKSLTSQVIPGGVQTYTFDVTVNGDTNIEPDETFLVNVTNVSGANVTDGQGVGTIQNDDLPSLSINDVSKKEGNGGPGTTTFTFTVHLSSPAPSNVTFDIATADGTAQDGNPAGEDNDYVARSVSGASISAGQQDYMFDVTVNGDTTDEPNETFFVNVTNVSGATVGDNQGQGTIQNDDGPSLSINDVTVTEGTSGTPTSAQFTVTLTGTITQTVTVNYATADDTAVAGSDYTATSGMLTFTPSGPSTQTITVQVTADSIADVLNRETFFVNLSGATNSDIGDSQGVGTIVDDEDKVVISQVYGGGGNSGATYKNDFIELFNRGTTTVTLTNYTVQYASGNSGTWNIIATLSGTLAPGQYLLIQAGPTGTNGATLSPDVVGATTNLAGTSGKVALVNGTGTLSGTCPSSASIIDFVGYGSTANVNCFEGAGPAPAPSTNNQQGVLRASGGCTDTNVNSSDFTAAAANPRNKTIIVATCP